MQRGSMSEIQQSPAYTDDQLHGRACIVCGLTDGDLLPFGHVPSEVRPGQSLVWAVVACPEHRGGTS